MRVVGLVLLASSLAQAASIIDEVPDVVEDGDTEEIYAEASRPAGDAMFGEMGGEAYDLGDMGGWDMGMDGYGEQDGQLIHALFSALDANQDDWLSPSELKEGLRKQQSQYIEQVEHAQHTEARRAHQRADRSGDAAVSADEFAEASHGLLFMPHVEAAVPKPRLFAFADADADGSLSEDELRALMFADTGPRHRELQSLVAEATMDAHDADRSGLLDTAELRRFLEAQADGEEPSPWHDHDEAAAVEGSAAEMEEADSSGDRLLDRAELGEYVRRALRLRVAARRGGLMAAPTCTSSCGEAGPNLVMTAAFPQQVPRAAFSGARSTGGLRAVCAALRVCRREGRLRHAGCA